MLALLKGFFDPLFFNRVILVLYAANVVNWLAYRKVGDASYWFGAFWITATVTYLYKH